VEKLKSHLADTNIQFGMYYGMCLKDIFREILGLLRTELKACGHSCVQSSSIMGRQFVVYLRLRSTAFVFSSVRKIQCEIKTVECTLSDSEDVVGGSE
jgi:hypothetical protein